MLHKINLPNQTQHLGWIVQFQNDLLHALCDPNVDAATVTVDWVKAKRPDIEGIWLKDFCGWSRKGMSMLTRMQAIASLPTATKQAVITHYDNNLRYVAAFDDTLPPPPATRPVPNSWHQRTSSAYRGFFEMFYNPVFDPEKGYPINAIDLNGELFTRKKYLEAYRASNSELTVCPLCDGDMGDPEMDHWLAKKHLPELNCHPKNLVEICGACNGPRNKRQKLTLDDGETQPFTKWFHPYLRPAVGNFRIEKQGLSVKLVSDDVNTQERLDKLTQLVNLDTRWQDEWRRLFKTTLNNIRGTRRRKHGQELDRKELLNKIDTWKNEAEDNIGKQPHALVQVYFLTKSLDINSDEFPELLIEALRQD